MNVSAHTLRRLVSVTGLAAVVAVLAVPTALARPADVDGNTTHRAPATVSGLDPAIATAMGANERVQVSTDLRSPDALDVGVRASASRLDPAIATAMAAHESPTVAAPVTSDGFDWSRFAIVLAAIGAVLGGIGVALAVQSHGKHTGHGKGSVTAA